MKVKYHCKYLLFMLIIVLFLSTFLKCFDGRAFPEPEIILYKPIGIQHSLEEIKKYSWYSQNISTTITYLAIF